MKPCKPNNKNQNQTGVKREDALHSFKSNEIGWFPVGCRIKDYKEKRPLDAVGGADGMCLSDVLVHDGAMLLACIRRLLWDDLVYPGNIQSHKKGSTKNSISKIEKRRGITPRLYTFCKPL